MVLIAGGRNKALDLGALRGRTRHGCARSSPSARPRARSRPRSPALVPVVHAGSMHDAVRAAAAQAQPGDIVLLSPACASFDWYESYAARGDDFAREVQLLPEGESARAGDGGLQ